MNPEPRTGTVHALEAPRRAAAGGSVAVAGAAVTGSRRTTVLLFLLGGISSGLWSWHPSLWTDEAATISAASRTLPQLWQMAHNIDAVHATYYAFMHVWVELFGVGQFTLRLPSALAVGVSTSVTYLLGRRLADHPTGLLAAVVFAVLPRTTWMGLEARPYAFSTLLAVASTLVLVVLVRHRPQPRPGARSALLLVAYALLAGCGIAVNIYLALLLVAHGITLLLTPRISWRLRGAWFTASVGGVLLASPVVWTALHQTGQLGGGAFGPGRWIRNVIVNQWFLGETPTLSTGGGSFDLSFGSSWKLASIALAGLCWLLVAHAVLNRRRVRDLLTWSLPWVVVPTLVIGLYSVAIHNFYNARYFSYATPGIALLVASGLVALRRPWLKVLVAALVLLTTAPVYVSQRTVYAKSSTDWSGVARFVAANRGERQAVYFAPRYPVTGPLVGQTARGVRTAYPAAFEGLRDLTLLRTPVQDANLSGTSLRLAEALPRLQGMDSVWVIRRNDYAYAAQDDAALVGAGFAPDRQWQGPLDSVIEFHRG